MWRDASGNKVSRCLPCIFAKSVLALHLDSSRKGFTIQAQQVLPHLFRSFWDRYRSRLGAVPKLCHFFWVDFSSKKIHVLLTVETCAIFFKRKKKGPAQTSSNSIRNFLPSSSIFLTNKPTPSLLLSNKMKQNPPNHSQPTNHPPTRTYHVLVLHRLPKHLPYHPSRAQMLHQRPWRHQPYRWKIHRPWAMRHWAMPKSGSKVKAKWPRQSRREKKQVNETQTPQNKPSTWIY